MNNRPREVTEFSDTALQITWDDGHESIYVYEDLRQACPCATCKKLRKETKSGRLPFKRAIPMGTTSIRIKPVQTESIGQYAYKFHWNDKHDTGIYTFAFLRGLCSCEECSTETE